MDRLCPRKQQEYISNRLLQKAPASFAQFLRRRLRKTCPNWPSVREGRTKGLVGVCPSTGHKLRLDQAGLLPRQNYTHDHLP